MKIYLVGGAVRDELLGRPVQDRDWVVVGALPSEFRALGYRQVGRDFPVFLHPDNGEEYALARTERKAGSGHVGFAVHAGPEVTLEDDLVRRDLTINAMAQSRDGRLIDPFGGQEDLAGRSLRHVGEAFREDPLRVFRVARFAARLGDFSVHRSTLAMMSDMSGKLGELSAERVWGEFRKALEAEAPHRFVEVLEAADCLDIWFPELRGVTINAALTGASHRYGALGLAIGGDAVAALGARLKAPGEYRDLAKNAVRHGARLGAWRTTDPARVYAAGKAVGALHHTPLSQQVFALAEQCYATPKGELKDLFDRLAAEIHAGCFRGEGLAGVALGRRIEAARIGQIWERQGPSQAHEESEWDADGPT